MLSSIFHCHSFDIFCFKKSRVKYNSLVSVLPPTCAQFFDFYVDIEVSQQLSRIRGGVCRNATLAEREIWRNILQRHRYVADVVRSLEDKVRII